MAARALLWIIIIAAVLIAGYFLFFAPAGYEPATAQAAISSLSAERPDFVIGGTNLDKVEIWTIPTGTSTTEADYTMLGQATLATSSGSAQVWTYPIPSQKMLITSVFARGYKGGLVVGQATLPQMGAPDLTKTLWGATSTATSSLGNPASINCTNLKGTLEIRNTASRQVGYCHLPNKTVCEEWALYRNNACVAPAL